jgi:hypothetical protein
MSTTLVAAATRWPWTRSGAVKRSHPGWWMSAGAAVAWTVLVIATVTGWPMSSHMSSPAMPPMAGMAPSGQDMGAAGHAGDAWGFSGHWMLMVAAMMWPLYEMPAAAIAQASFRRWRAVTVGTFVVVLSASWLVFGYIARAAYRLVGTALPPWVWAVSWLAVAIAATWPAWRARALRKCRRVGVQAPHGRRAIVTAAQNAVRQLPRCMLLCGPVMVAMVAAHQLPLMLGGSLAVWWEQRHPRAWRDPVPAVILAVTGVVVLAGLLWKGAAAAML